MLTVREYKGTPDEDFPGRFGKTTRKPYNVLL